MWGQRTKGTKKSSGRRGGELSRRTEVDGFFTLFGRTDTFCMLL